MKSANTLAEFHLGRDIVIGALFMNLLDSSFAPGYRDVGLRALRRLRALGFCFLGLMLCFSPCLCASVVNK